MEHVWSTERLPERDQFAHWHEVCAEAFVPVDVRRAGEGRFRSRVAARRVGPLTVSRIASEPQAVHRTASAIAGGGEATVFVNLPLTAGSSARQDGRTAALHPGDFTIVDASRPFELGFASAFSQVSLQVPRELVMRRGVPAHATAVRIPGHRGAGAVASHALRAFAADTTAIDERGARRLAEHVCGLVVLALEDVVAPMNPRASRSVARAQLFEAALDHAERRLADPGLTPREVADFIAVSPRQLHRLFAERGTTFGRWLLQRRLAAGHERLLAAECGGLSIGEIAYGAGFPDPSYFARAFKARYGMTPGMARRAVV